MVDMNTFGAFGVDIITCQRFDDELQVAATRSLLRRSRIQQPGLVDLAAASLGDRLIRAGQWLKQRHEPERASAVSPWRVADKGV